MGCVLCEVGTEILYAIAMTISPHRVKIVCDWCCSWLKKTLKFKLEDVFTAVYSKNYYLPHL
jgi:hypothetical protein